MKIRLLTTISSIITDFNFHTETHDKAPETYAYKFGLLCIQSLPVHKFIDTFHNLHFSPRHNADPAPCIHTGGG